MAESFVPSVTLHFLHVREPEKLADGVDIEAAETWSRARGLSYFNIINFIQEPHTRNCLSSEHCTVGDKERLPNLAPLQTQTIIMRNGN